jgi:hypothetical protein
MFKATAPANWCSQTEREDVGSFVLTGNSHYGGQLGCIDHWSKPDPMRDELRTLIESYDHSREREARELYVEARSAATELRVTSGGEESRHEADEIDALADLLKTVFEAREQEKINLTD